MLNKNYRPVALIILDGWGYREETKDNAIATADTPFFDSLWQNYPHTLLKASGDAVGLPEGQIGNSEVGHMTIGAGTPIDTDLVRISKAAEAGEFTQNPAFQKLFSHVKEHHSTLHVAGLIGPGGVHSLSEHLFAFLRTARAAGVSNIAIHAFMDGRDLPPQSGAGYLKEVEQVLADIGNSEIATVTGRFYAMDRDHNWDRTDKALGAIFEGYGRKETGSPSVVLAELYKSEEALDEHLEPLIFTDQKVRDHDGFFFFNYRSDRARQLSQRISDKADEMNLCFVTMTEYEPSLKALVAFPPQKITMTLAKALADAGLTQAHIAETEKFAHATYFLDGGNIEPAPGEKQILLESRKDIKTHDQAPEMRAKDIADAALEEISAGTDFLFINFANADMVGHTGNVPATITAIETLDRELKRVVEAILDKNGVAIISADHGNAELNIDPATGAVHTAHTTNPVPVIVTTTDIKLKDGQGLASLAPTVLDLLEIDKPTDMTGISLIS